MEGYDELKEGMRHGGGEVGEDKRKSRRKKKRLGSADEQRHPVPGSSRKPFGALISVVTTFTPLTHLGSLLFIISVERHFDGEDK